MAFRNSGSLSSQSKVRFQKLEVDLKDISGPPKLRREPNIDQSGSPENSTDLIQPMFFGGPQVTQGVSISNPPPHSIVIGAKPDKPQQEIPSRRPDTPRFFKTSEPKPPMRSKKTRSPQYFTFSEKHQTKGCNFTDPESDQENECSSTKDSPPRKSMS